MTYAERLDEVYLGYCELTQGEGYPHPLALEMLRTMFDSKLIDDLEAGL